MLQYYVNYVGSPLSFFAYDFNYCQNISGDYTKWSGQQIRRFMMNINEIFIFFSLNVMNEIGILCLSSLFS